MHDGTADDVRRALGAGRDSGLFGDLVPVLIGASAITRTYGVRRTS